MIRCFLILLLLIFIGCSESFIKERKEYMANKTYHISVMNEYGREVDSFEVEARFDGPKFLVYKDYTRLSWHYDCGYSKYMSKEFPENWYCKIALKAENQ